MFFLQIYTIFRVEFYSNHSAFYALIPASLIPILCVLLPQLSGLANFTWFIGMGFGFVIYRFLNQPLAHVKSAMTKVKVQ